MSSLVKVDELEAVVIIDNEVDCMSWIAPDTVDVSGRFPDLCLNNAVNQKVGGQNVKVIPMEAMSCGAHGLSVLVTATKDGVKHSVLFDTGPEEEAWERNAVEMISEAKKASNSSSSAVIVDLHSDRPEFRGFMVAHPVAMPADPTFDEIRAVGGAVFKSSGPHTVLDDKFLISGNIPWSAAYETGLQNGIRISDLAKGWEKDEEMADERFLMCNLKGKGIVMFTGCSHRGVVNASRSAVEQLSSEVPLHAVLGGYHLVASSQAQVEETVKDLKTPDPKVLLPGHCSGWRVKYEIEKQMPGRLVPCTAGSKIKF
ncbi:hypothetical protein G7Y89_g1364 [Cudoniella acicularis]|uniref:Metallo-beta-lactamase domain-containing protein n=1 Tax=Cudoniella acicularis TaxID=354080 RepID=A0A8H4RXE4_9HELO|nr:hypothetical protein G7Y89_g1364 [Cudoniella acicularis]